MPLGNRVVIEARGVGPFAGRAPPTKRSCRAATPEHPFGYGRKRYVYAFVVSIALFSIGGLFALYEARHKWSDPNRLLAMGPDRGPPVGHGDGGLRAGDEHPDHRASHHRAERVRLGNCEGPLG